MRVSIVIPAHNEEHCLRACLQSIAEQTIAPLEVIVVDNNSTDATATIAADFAFVRVIREEQEGIVYARNTGFDAARGDVIGRIDADVILPPQWLEHISRFYDNATHHGVAWTGGGFFYNVPFPALVSWMYSLIAFRINRLLSATNTLWGSNMAITKAQWAAVRSGVHGRTDIHEDLDLALHLADAGYRIHYDSHIKTNAELRPAVSDRHNLWQYVQWWPNTLKVHGRRQWIVVWLVSVLVLYPGVYALALLDKFSSLKK
jgi:glycosyltransferase involved in cell wall biosynthesis